MSIFDNLGYKHRDNDILQKVIAAVEEGYEDKRRPLEIVKKNSFSPSQIGYKHNRCPRLWAMKFAGRYMEQATGEHDSLARMDEGTNAGIRIQEALQAAGVAKELEFEVKHDDPPIRGFVDGILDIDGETVLLEIKTTRMEAFNWRVIKMVGPPYQMYQILIYMYLLDIKHGVLLYENTNDKHLCAVPVELTDENKALVEEALDWMREVWKAHQEDKLPARPWKKESANCKDCPLFNECWNNEPREDVVLKPMGVHKW